MRLGYICLLSVLILSACSQEPQLDGEHFVYYDECALLQEYNLHTTVDCVEYALQAYEDERLVFEETCHISGLTCESAKTEEGYTQVYVDIIISEQVDAVDITYSTITRSCQIREDRIRCSLPFVAMDRDQKQAFELEVVVGSRIHEGLILAYV